MGAYAYAVIGIKISAKEIKMALEKEAQTKTTYKKACSHDIPENAKFCPECGASKELIKVIQSPREIYCFLDGLKLKYHTDTDDCNYFFTTSNEFILATDDIDASGGYDSMNYPPLDKIMCLNDDLKSKFEPYGLWNEKNFRIWLIGQYC